MHRCTAQSNSRIGSAAAGASTKENPRRPFATGSAGLAFKVRGSSRRIMTMRFRPANISLINRRHYLPRLLLTLSSKYNDKNNPSDLQMLTGHTISGTSWPQPCAMSTRSSQEQTVRNCLTDEGRPLEVGLQERASNRLPAAVDKSHGRERGRKRPSEDWVRCQARRGLQGNHY